MYFVRSYLEGVQVIEAQGAGVLGSYAKMDVVTEARYVEC